MQSKDIEEGKRRAVAASLPRMYPGALSTGPGDGGEIAQRAPAGAVPRVGTLVCGGGSHD
jgi:hypothetical protein